MVLRLRLIALAAVLGALVTAGVAYGASSSTAAVKKPAVVKPIKITVTLREYSFTFSKKSVKHGSTVLFTVINKGTLQHNMDIVGVKRTPILGPGKKTTVKVVFKKKGSFQVVCDVPRHIQLGMVSSFKVT